MKYSNPYYALDEIGFVGTQKKQSKNEIKRDIELVTASIKADKLKRVNGVGKKPRISTNSK